MGFVRRESAGRGDSRRYPFVASVIAGTLHYADANAVAAVRDRGRSRSPGSRASSLRDRAGRRALRACATGVLQSTLGNLPEFFIVLFALSAGEVVVAQTSVVGSLFANALLVLGLAIVVGALARGRRHALPPRLPQGHGDAAAARASFIIVLVGLSPRSHDRGERPRRRDLGRRRGRACSASTACGSGATCARTSRASPRRAAAAPALPLRGRGRCCSRLAGVGAAFVSDWFVDALEPGDRDARDLAGVHRAS